MLDAGAVKPGVGKKSGVECRNAHHRCCLGQMGENPIEIESRQQDHGCAGHHACVDGREETVRVIERQSVQKDIAPGELPKVAEHKRIRSKVSLRQHRALRAPCCAGRIENGRHVVARTHRIIEAARHRTCALREGAGAPIVAEGQKRRMVAEQSLNCFRLLRRCDEADRFGVREVPGRFGGRIGGIERHIDRARPQAGQIEQKRFGAFFDLNGKPVAGPNACRVETIGELGRAHEHIVVGEVPPIRGAEKRPVAFRHGRSNLREETFIHLRRDRSTLQPLRLAPNMNVSA
jgi:hypothetical protein